MTDDNDRHETAVGWSSIFHSYLSLIFRFDFLVKSAKLSDESSEKKMVGGGIKKHFVDLKRKKVSISSLLDRV